MSGNDLMTASVNLTSRRILTEATSCGFSPQSSVVAHLSRNDEAYIFDFLAGSPLFFICCRRGMETDPLVDPHSPTYYLPPS